ncbi:hypothetical protein M9435_005075 [Picochlorum sp. BPE23]|nr:hypothetical protein M9435_005075 [Picochlorum sp. BPE23]
MPGASFSASTTVSNIVLSIGSGIYKDIRKRFPWYESDWKDVGNNKLRVAAASTYIFFASVVPALAFGEQFASETDGLINVVHVLAACATTGVMQAVFGGQPLLIVGVAEPIVLVYKYMYDFAKDREDLGRNLFLAWSSWVCVFTAIFVAVLAVTNACVYINKFTRFAGEAFGALIAILFMQQAIKGLVEEFQREELTSDGRTMNGLWSLFLAFGMVITSLMIRKARKWRFLFAPLRALLADYGVPLLVVVWTGLSYAVDYPGVPARVQTPNTWDVKDCWKVTTVMSSVPSKYIGAAVIPAIIITVLFFFDHNVSSQLAQQPEFNLKKPSTYHYDMMLLALMTLLCGLLGIPPVNGVIPQSPMHTKSLALVESGQRKRQREHASANGIREGSKGVNGTSTEISTPPHDGGAYIPLRVAEQRGSGLAQALAIGACLGLTPAIRWLPTAVLWGYFAFMACESLPGSQLWERILLLLTDPKRRYMALEEQHVAFLETVPFKVIAAFTALQTVIVLGIYGITWAGVAGVLFPIPIMLLVPFRQYIMPKMFNAVYLEELDKLTEEEAGPLPHEEAIREAQEQGLGIEDGQEEEDIESEMAHFRVVHHASHREIEARRSSIRHRHSRNDNSSNNSNHNDNNDQGNSV